jgi:hypothetical protein
VPAFVAPAVILPLGPVGLLLRRGEAPAAPPSGALGEVAERAGCRLTEFQVDMETNPPVRGRFVERIPSATVRTRDSAGTQFDPAIVSIFEQLLADRAKPPTSSTTA